MARITITLLDDESNALVQLAKRERRSPRQQAAILVRKQLRNLGMLPETILVQQSIDTEVSHDDRPTSES